MRPILNALALLAIVFAASVCLPAASAQAHALTTLSAKFPTGAEGVAAAYVAPYVYFFGGYNGTDGGRTDLIYRLDPTSGTMTTVAAKLPRPMHGLAAAAAGGKVYLFGGYATVDVPREPVHKDWVQVFDPAAATVTTSDETFAAAMGSPASQEYGFYYMSAAAVDGKVYVFGGANAEGRFKLVFEYDAATDELTRQNAALPRGISEAAAVAVGKDIFLFGGIESDPAGDGPVDEVRKYNVTHDRFDEFDGRLAEPLRGATAAAGPANDAYIFGGKRANGDPVRTIQHLHFASFVDPTGADLPGPRTRAAAVWTGKDIIVAGGLDGETRLRDILRFKPTDPSAFTGGNTRTPTTSNVGDASPQETPTLPVGLALVVLVSVAALAPRRR